MPNTVAHSPTMADLIGLLRQADYDIQGVLADCDMRAEKANSLNQLLREIRATLKQVQTMNTVTPSPAVRFGASLAAANLAHAAPNLDIDGEFYCSDCEEKNKKIKTLIHTIEDRDTRFIKLLDSHNKLWNRFSEFVQGVRSIQGVLSSAEQGTILDPLGGIREIIKQVQVQP